MQAIGLKICVLAFLMVVINGTTVGRWTVLSPKTNSPSQSDQRKYNGTGMPLAPRFINHEIDESSIVDEIMVEAHLANIVKLTKAIKAMLNVLKHSCFVDKEVKELLEASRTFGLLLQESSVKELEKTPEMKALKDVKEKLLYEMNEDAFQFMNVPDNEHYFVKKSIINPIKTLQSRIHDVLTNASTKTLKQLKEKCHDSNPLTVAKTAMSKLDDLIATFVDTNVPDKDDYLDLKKVYTVAFKKLIAFSSICNTFINETTVFNMAKSINDTQLYTFVHEIKAKFIKSYWSTKRITNDIKTQIKIGGTNSEIAFNIFDELMDEYKDFGYTYHVGVSGLDIDINNATLIYCITECKYLNNYKKSNVNVLRNIKQKGKKYQVCDFLTSLQNSHVAKEWCNNHKQTYGDLRDLADAIIDKCKNPGFSIAVNRVDYQTDFDKKGKEFFDHHFDLPCYGNVHIAAINNPLP